MFEEDACLILRIWGEQSCLFSPTRCGKACTEYEFIVFFEMRIFDQLRMCLATANFRLQLE